MGEVVNLNQARKIKARADDKARAAANRAAHGRSRAERKLSLIHISEPTRPY